MDFYGYEAREFAFEGQSAIVVFPREANGKLALKTEYWGAFPEAIELPLLENGFHLCYVKNNTRWGTREDLDRQARFVRYVQSEYGLCGKCVPVGMSCGGLIAIKLAARYPEIVSCLYLDAPVVNYMSCPCGFGRGNALSGDLSEILTALSLPDAAHLMAYRDMPLDNLPKLIRAKIPAVIVAGDSDMTVPFDENGYFVQQAYADAGVPIEVYIKTGCDHHPHGLKDPSPALDFILKYA